jgi:hypothetical protein
MAEVKSDETSRSGLSTMHPKIAQLEKHQTVIENHGQAIYEIR